MSCARTYGVLALSVIFRGKDEAFASALTRARFCCLVTSLFGSFLIPF
jgi:hypothetical protein